MKEAQAEATGRVEAAEARAAGLEGTLADLHKQLAAREKRLEGLREVRKHRKGRGRGLGRTRRGHMSAQAGAYGVGGAEAATAHLRPPAL